LFKRLRKSSAYLRVDEQSPLPWLDISEEWAAIIVAELPFSDERRIEVARWLYKENCRWMAAWGIECSKWDDAVDEAEIEQWPDGAPDTKTTMTTWHDRKNLDEVFWFIGTQVETMDEKQMTHFVIVHLSHNDKERELTQRFAAALTL
jgi:hypothetical protein